MNAANLAARAASTSSLASADAVEAKDRKCGALRAGTAEALAAALAAWVANLKSIVVVCVWMKEGEDK